MKRWAVCQPPLAQAHPGSPSLPGSFGTALCTTLCRLVWKVKVLMGEGQAGGREDLGFLISLCFLWDPQGLLNPSGCPPPAGGSHCGSGFDWGPSAASRKHHHCYGSLGPMASWGSSCGQSLGLHLASQLNHIPANTPHHVVPMESSFCDYRPPCPNRQWGHASAFHCGAAGLSRVRYSPGVLR